MAWSLDAQETGGGDDGEDGQMRHPPGKQEEEEGRWETWATQKAPWYDGAYFVPNAGKVLPAVSSIRAGKSTAGAYLTQQGRRCLHQPVFFFYSLDDWTRLV